MKRLYMVSISMPRCSQHMYLSAPLLHTFVMYPCFPTAAICLNIIILLSSCSCLQGSFQARRSFLPPRGSYHDSPPPRVWMTKVSKDIGQDNGFNMVHHGVARADLAAPGAKQFGQVEGFLQHNIIHTLKPQIVQKTRLSTRLCQPCFLNKTWFCEPAQCL